MKTKAKNGKEKGGIEEYAGMPIFIIVLLSVMLIFTILASFLTITNLRQLINSTITNLTHSLAQANAIIAEQKAQIANLTNLLNLNESQIIFNKAISIGPGKLISTCTVFNCSYYPSVVNTTLHFNFTHAGYIVINTTGQSYVFLLLMQNYSRTWSGVNDSGAAGTFNFSVRSLTMPVLPGSASLKLFYYNATVPYEAQLTITYHS